MKTSRYFILAFATVLLAAQFAYLSPANAQTSERIQQDRVSRGTDPSTSVDEFRKEYDNYLNDKESDMRLLSSAHFLPSKNRQAILDSLRHFDEARRASTTMTPEDWVKVRDIYAKFPGWRNSLLSPALRRRIEAAQALQGGDGHRVDEISPDPCPDEADVASATDIGVAKATLAGLQAAAEGIPETLLPAKVAAILLALGNEEAVIALETTRTIHLECLGAFKSDIETIVDLSRSKLYFDLGADFAHVGSSINQAISNDNSNRDIILASLTGNNANITTAVASAKTEIVNNDNSNKTQIINNDNSNKTAIVNNDNANALTITNMVTVAKNELLANGNANKNELRDLMLRTQIEADLAQADNATYVAWYVMPTAVGGHFDFARAIVVETIAKLAGSSTSSANGFLAQSDAAKNAGDYKAAYRNLRKAYKAAIN